MIDMQGFYIHEEPKMMGRVTTRLNDEQIHRLKMMDMIYAAKLDWVFGVLEEKPGILDIPWDTFDEMERPLGEPRQAP